MPTTRQTVPWVRQARASANKRMQATLRAHARCNRLYVLTPEGRHKYQAAYERVKPMAGQIDGKRIANFANLLDVDTMLALRWSKRYYPLVRSSIDVGNALEVLEEALYRSDPDSGEIAETVARIDISASEEEDEGERARTPGAFPRM
eukprot:6209254-Pleurochrysis_carterae.AAC.4